MVKRLNVPICTVTSLIVILTFSLAAIEISFWSSEFEYWMAVLDLFDSNIQLPHFPTDSFLSVFISLDPYSYMKVILLSCSYSRIIVP